MELKTYDFTNPAERKTTFLEEFFIANAFGANAIECAFDRAFEECERNIVYIAELACVVNYWCWKCWEQNDRKYEERSSLYQKYFYQLKDYVYADDSPFTEEEQSYFFDMID